MAEGGRLGREPRRMDWRVLSIDLEEGCGQEGRKAKRLDLVVQKAGTHSLSFHPVRMEPRLRGELGKERAEVGKPSHQNHLTVY